MKTPLVRGGFRIYNFPPLNAFTVSLRTFASVLATETGTSGILDLYTGDSLIQSLVRQLGSQTGTSIQLRNVRGSLDSILISSVFNALGNTQLIVVDNKDDAAYAHNDLQNLLSREEILYYPSSYKKPYQYEHVDNANVLRRSEILSRLNIKNNGIAPANIIVTYSEALAEKVINKRSLIENTVIIESGGQHDLETIQEKLLGLHFEQADFVYEAGQFAIRGGILDVYSFSNNLPYRIEFFGDEIEGIRLFDPLSQLSKENAEKAVIIPNVSEKLEREESQSFFEFLPDDTIVWFKDLKYSEDTISQCFNKCKETFDNLVKQSGNTQVIVDPEKKFETRSSFTKEVSKFSRVEFGNRFYLQDAVQLEFSSEPQPSFNKNFDLLVENLSEYMDKGYKEYICSDSEAQIGRLFSIFQELDPDLLVHSLNFSLRKGFIDNLQKIICYTDHEIFERFHRYKLKERFTKSKAITLKELQSLQPGDFVTHIDYGIGRFAGLEKINVGGHSQEAIRLVYRDNDLLYVSIHSLHKISKYSGREGVPPVVSKLGSNEWANKKKRVKKKVADIAADLIELYAKRKKASGHAFSEDSFLQAELESSFIYDDTPDQSRATNEVKEDMHKPYPMDRLVCGDVGFGKTEVALRAAFKAIDNGKQVAVLVPTTILAMQHYRTFKDRLLDFPISIDYLNRFKSTAQAKKTLKETADGTLNILIGTHRIVNRDVKFKDLGLLIIDEEQKFGVRIKEKLKAFKVNVDVLTLTATPIPRTLHFSLMGARDLSIIATPPANRQPITTELHEFDEEFLRDVISYELRRGGQVFFVHNRIFDIEEVANIIFRLVPDAKITIAHGQMKGPKLEKNMLKFINGEYDILVSTNIIESGLDIPNSNTIIINHAHLFGLSDLHQMRGRVGRSNRKAYCYLLTPPAATLTSDARKRLQTLEEFSELGDGFKVAMRDLDIRGAGNLLGAEQSGFISDLGFDMYHKILDEAVQELKENEFKDLFKDELAKTAQMLVKDCAIETDLEILIPESYVRNISERLRLYNKLDNIQDEEKLEAFKISLLDRFGTIPQETLELIQSVRLRWEAQKLGFEKLTLKDGDLKGYFVSKKNEEFYKSETFGKILEFIKSLPQRCRIQEFNKRLILILKDITSIEEAINTLGDIRESVPELH